MATPTSRTLDYYRQQGMPIEVVEKWNQWSKIRQDLFGFADLVTFDGQAVYLVQATSTGNMSARVKKILANPTAELWVQNKNRKIIVIGWRKYAQAKDGKWWRETIREITKEDF